MKPKTLATALIVLVGANGFERAEAISVRGAGQDSCGSWTMQRQGAETVEKGTVAVAQAMWVLGYVSAFESPLGTSASIDNGGLFAWMDNYCAKHPLDNIAAAASHLVESLKLVR